MLLVCEYCLYATACRAHNVFGLGFLRDGWMQVSQIREAFCSPKQHGKPSKATKGWDQEGLGSVQKGVLGRSPICW